MRDDVISTGLQKLIYSYSLSTVVSGFESMGANRKHNGCLGSESMTTLEERIEAWIYAECNETKPQTRHRFRELNHIFRDIYTDSRFWQYQNHANRDDYEEALSRMWRYFRLNLCQATTARKSGSFLETRTYAIGRLLTNLKGHLKNIQIAKGSEAGIYVQPGIDDEGMVLNSVEMLPNPEPDIAARQFDAFLNLLETDPTGELTAEENILRGRDEAYTLTAQQYLLMRHRDDMTIQQIADELEVPRGSVQGGTKPTRWKELEHKFSLLAMDSVSA